MSRFLQRLWCRLTHCERIALPHRELGDAEVCLDCLEVWWAA